MKFEEYKITLSLSVEQVNMLSGLARLYNDRVTSEGYNGGYTECSYLQQLLSFRLDEILSDELDFQRRRGKEQAEAVLDSEAGDLPARNPSPEEAETPSPLKENRTDQYFSYLESGAVEGAAPEEPETVSNGEEETPLPVSADADMQKKKVDITFSVTEGDMIHSALCDVGERVLARRFPHTCFFPVEDESLYGAVWEGDTSMALDTEECCTIANALFARSLSQWDKGHETIGDELSGLASRISRAAYPVRMANLAVSLARCARKKETGYLPARNPSPDESHETL